MENKSIKKIITGLSDGISNNNKFKVIGVIIFVIFLFSFYFFKYMDSFSSLVLMWCIFSCLIWINPIIFKADKEKIKLLDNQEKKEYLKGYRYASVSISFASYIFLTILFVIFLVLMENFGLSVYPDGFTFG